MKTIHPIHQGEMGPPVANLHKGLLFIFFHEFGVSPETRRALRDRLAADVLEEKYITRSDLHLLGSTHMLLGLCQTLLQVRRGLGGQRGA